jgi:hypothetical protein
MPRGFRTGTISRIALEEAKSGAFDVRRLRPWQATAALDGNVEEKTVLADCMAEPALNGRPLWLASQRFHRSKVI